MTQLLTIGALWLCGGIVIAFLFAVVKRHDRIIERTAEPEVWHRHTISDFTARASRGKP